MSKSTELLIKAARDYSNFPANIIFENSRLQAEVTRMETELAELRTEKLVREGQEAVAVIHSDRLRWLVLPDDHPAHTGTHQLYLAAGAKPALVPMTAVEIHTVLNAARPKWTSGSPNVFIARAIEAHHKIGVPK